MTAIKIVVFHMHDTLEEANEYYRDYLFYKEDHPKLASVALDMAKSHIEMYQKWHSVAVDLIAEYRKSGKMIPDGMEDRYNDLHEELKDEYNRLAYLISQAK